MAKSRAIANLAVVISARTKAFEKGFERASKAIKRWKSNTIAAIGAISRKIALFGAAIGAGLAYSILASTKRLDAFVKSADRLKIGPERLAAMQHAAKLAGMETEKLNMALLYLRRRASEAVGPGALSTAVKSFDMLGVSAAELMKLPLDQQLAEVGKGLNRLVNPSDRIRVSMDLFGRSGAGMINLLAGGGRAIDDAAAKLRKFGALFSRAELGGIEAFNDAMTDFTALLTAMRDKLAVRAAPYLTVITEYISELTQGAAAFGNTLVEGLVKALAVADSLRAAMQWAEKAHLRAQIAALKIILPVQLAQGAAVSGGMGRRNLNEWDRTPITQAQKDIAMAPAKGTLQAIHEFEKRLAKLSEMPEELGSWAKKVEDLIKAFHIEVAVVKSNIRAKLLGARLGEWANRMTSRGDAATAAAVKASAAGAGDSKYTWGEVSRTRTAFPSGVSAIRQAKTQQVKDEKVASIAERIYNFLVNNADKLTTQGWATVK